MTTLAEAKRNVLEQNLRLETSLQRKALAQQLCIYTAKQTAKSPVTIGCFFVAGCMAGTMPKSDSTRKKLTSGLRRGILGTLTMSRLVSRLSGHLNARP